LLGNSIHNKSRSKAIVYDFVEKYHTVGTIPKSNIKIVERGKIDISNTQIHDCPLSWLGTDTSIKSGGFNGYHTLKGNNSLKSVERFDHMMFACRFQASR
jgi:hypothetical protein